MPITLFPAEENNNIHSSFPKKKKNQRTIIHFFTASLMVTLIFTGYIAVKTLSVNTSIEEVINETSREMAGVKITVTSADVSSHTGRGILTGLALYDFSDSPQAHLLQLSKLWFTAHEKTFFSKDIFLKKVHIESPVLFYREKHGFSNIHEVVKSLTTFTGKKKKSHAFLQQTGKLQGVTYINIDSLSFTGVKIIVNGKNFTLPDIHMADIGKEKQLTLSELLLTLLTKLELAIAHTLAEKNTLAVVD